MCVQCMMGAAAAGTAVTGARSYLATRRWSWLTPMRLRRATMGLVGTGLVASALFVSGSSGATAPGTGTAGPAQVVLPAR